MSFRTNAASMHTFSELEKAKYIEAELCILSNSIVASLAGKLTGTMARRPLRYVRLDSSPTPFCSC